jgi:DNA topoisomerase-2
MNVNGVLVCLCLFVFFCELLGDSAKALAVAGLSIIGRDFYGVFPWRGKFINVREASMKQMMDNAEIKSLKQIIGLQSNMTYTDTKQLRYGRVMLMCDQDHDGSHIKGLLMNFFQQCWPSLLLLKPSFLWEFITPIIKVSHGISSAGIASARAKEILFYSINDYENWLKQQEHAARTAVSAADRARAKQKWTVKYYKGLGTSTAADAKAYFSDFARHSIEFAWDAHAAESLTLAFDAKKADARKEWLGNYNPATNDLDQSGRDVKMTFSDFMNKEFIKFSCASNERAIPSVVDGLKTSQRKILFAAFKRSLTREVKVAQFVGYISEHTAYRHGESSLCTTLINMAQTFVGSNNVNLFLPLGQFGTRHQGGKDAASPRYIFTTLSPVTRPLFPAVDDPILTYGEDDGIRIEPKWYLPVIPMVLVNGSAGIGTGWSSVIPNYSPYTLIDLMYKLLQFHEDHLVARGRSPRAHDAGIDDHLQLADYFRAHVPDLQPWYRFFTGTITPHGSSRFQTKGVIELLPNGTSIHIRELALYTWNDSYKQVLEELLVAGDILEFKEHHTDTEVSYVVDMHPDTLTKWHGKMYKNFKLVQNVNTSNMVLFTAAGTLKLYATALDIAIDFYMTRFPGYIQRKTHLVALKRAEEIKLTNKVRFISSVCQLLPGDVLHIHNRSVADIEAQLDAKKYTRIRDSTKSTCGTTETTMVHVAGDVDADDENDDDDDEILPENTAAASASAGPAVRTSSKNTPTFDYLLNMSMRSVSKDRIATLTKELDTIRTERAELEAQTPHRMWRLDLDACFTALKDHDAHVAKQAADATAKARKKRMSAGKSTDVVIPKGTVLVEDDGDVDNKKKRTKTTHVSIPAEDVHIVEDDDESDEVIACDPPAGLKARAATSAAAASASSASASAASAASSAGRMSPESIEEDEDLNAAIRASLSMRS